MNMSSGPGPIRESARERGVEPTRRAGDPGSDDFVGMLSIAIAEVAQPQERVDRDSADARGESDDRKFDEEQEAASREVESDRRPRERTSREDDAIDEEGDDEASAAARDVVAREGKAEEPDSANDAKSAEAKAGASDRAEQSDEAQGEDLLESAELPDGDDSAVSGEGEKSESSQDSQEPEELPTKLANEEEPPADEGEANELPDDLELPEETGLKASSEEALDAVGDGEEALPQAAARTATAPSVQGSVGVASNASPVSPGAAASSPTAATAGATPSNQPNLPPGLLQHLPGGAQVTVLSQSEGGKSALVELQHPTLGPLRLEVNLTDSVVNVRAVANSVASAIALRHAEHALRANIAMRGMDLRGMRIDVSEEPNQERAAAYGRERPVRTRRRRGLSPDSTVETEA